MRRAATILAVAVATVATVALWTGCSGEPPIQVGPESTGPELYVGLGCAKCHGAEREGLRTAPPVDNVAAHYDEAKLINFLKDPAGTEVSVRLKQLRESYPLRMPPVTTADDTMMKTLVGFLLSPPQAEPEQGREG